MNIYKKKFSLLQTMIRNAVVLSIFLKIGFLFPNLKFLNHLEVSENANFVYIIMLDEIECSNEIIKSLASPKITLKGEFNINYLNFPRFDRTNSIKYYFNHNFMTILLLEYFNEKIFENPILYNTIGMSRDRILILISNTKFNNSEYILESFYKFKFTNVIYFDADSLKNSENFETFEAFPQFRKTSRISFVKETIRNVKLMKIKVLCNRLFPLTYCFQENNKIVGVGRIFHLMKNFVQ